MGVLLRLLLASTLLVSPIVFALSWFSSLPGSDYEMCIDGNGRPLPNPPNQCTFGPEDVWRVVLIIVVPTAITTVLWWDQNSKYPGQYQNSFFFWLESLKWGTLNSFFVGLAIVLFPLTGHMVSLQDSLRMIFLIVLTGFVSLIIPLLSPIWLMMVHRISR